MGCAPLPPFASPAPAPGLSGCQGATTTRCQSCQRCRCRCCRYGLGAAVSPGGARAATAAPAAVCATLAAPGRDGAPPAPPNPQQRSRCETGRLTAATDTDTSRRKICTADNTWLHQCVGGRGRSPLRPTTRPSSTLPAPVPQASRRALRSKLPLPPPARRGRQGTHTGRCCRRLPTDSGTFNGWRSELSLLVS